MPVGPGCVRVRLRYSSVSASSADLPDPKLGTSTSSGPAGLGHVGTVEEAGPSCGDNLIGRRVLIPPAALRRQPVVRESACAPPPDEREAGVAPHEEAVLAVAAAALGHVRSVGLRLGDPVLVLGKDPVALLTLQWARLQGAMPLVFGGFGPAALTDVARQLGADQAFRCDSARSLRDLAKWSGDEGFRAVFDGVGSRLTVTDGLHLLGRAGKLVFIGQQGADVESFNLYPDLHCRDLELVAGASCLEGADVEGGGCSRWKDLVAATYRILRRGRLQVETLVGDVIPWQGLLEHLQRLPGDAAWKAHIVDWDGFTNQSD